MTTTGREDSNDDMSTILQPFLGASLPGLTDEELESLGQQVMSELELRVGSVLSDGLTDAQLEEFEQLTDRGEDGACTAWLAAAKPNFRATVLTECTGLIAEVVAEVLKTDPSAARGQRHFSETTPVSMDLITHHLAAREMPYQAEPEGRVTLVFGESTSGPEVVMTIRLIDRGVASMFVFTGFAPLLRIPAERRAEMAAFTENWNRRKWIPKAYLKDDDASCQYGIVAEVAAPTGRQVTRDFVDGMINQCLGATLALFREFEAALRDFPCEAAQRGDDCP